MEKYCAFIDVLGYKAIVSDASKSIDQKIATLESIYGNLASQISVIINEINSLGNDKIFIKSFSDCFYLECDSLMTLLFSCKEIFKGAFGFYSNFNGSEEYTPLLRCGVVKDWTVRFRDLASFVAGEQITNPVGLGVARAYLTSEKTKLSGMRIIMSSEVEEDLRLIEYSRNGYHCYFHNYAYHHMALKFFFDRITENEENHPTNLLELIWPEEAMSDCTYDYVEQLKKIKHNFSGDSVRHFKKTSEIILKGLLISDCNGRTAGVFDKNKNQLIAFTNG